MLPYALHIIILCFLNFLCKVLINLFMLYITFFSIALPIVSPLHLPNLALYICTYVCTYNIIASFGLMELVVAQIRPKTWEGIMCVCSYVCVCVASFVWSPQTICWGDIITSSLWRVIIPLYAPLTIWQDRQRCVVSLFVAVLSRCQHRCVLQPASFVCFDFVTRFVWQCPVCYYRSATVFIQVQLYNSHMQVTGLLIIMSLIGGFPWNISQIHALQQHTVRLSGHFPPMELM